MSQIELSCVRDGEQTGALMQADEQASEQAYERTTTMSKQRAMKMPTTVRTMSHDETSRAADRRRVVFVIVDCRDELEQTESST